MRRSKEKVKILSYTDEKFTAEYLGELSLAINPSSFALKKEIKYNEDKEAGGSNSANSFNSYGPEAMSFDFIVDCTGVVEGTLESDKVSDIISNIEAHLYGYSSEAHRPPYVKLAYGEILFKGQLQNMDVDYQLFNSQGIPFRAKVSLSFSGYCEKNEQNKKNGKLSPDMSRVIILKEGDTLAALCQQIYDNSLLVGELARFNSLNGFRDIPAGTKLLFPHLRKG